MKWREQSRHIDDISQFDPSNLLKAFVLLDTTSSLAPWKFMNGIDWTQNSFYNHLKAFRSQGKTNKFEHSIGHNFLRTLSGKV
jgi:hypothetical protein